MTAPNTQLRLRGQYRFWHPIDYRYEYYSWPTEIVAKCHKCGGRFDFNAIIPEHFVKDPVSEGYSLVKQPITTLIQGKGACPKCAYQAQQISWPADAYFQTEVAGGSVWAWNENTWLFCVPRSQEIVSWNANCACKTGYIAIFLAGFPSTLSSSVIVNGCYAN